MIGRRLHRAVSGEEGFSLTEMLVGVLLLGVVTTLLFTVAISSARNLQTVRETTDLNEESRLVLNRMSREIREAKSIVAATNPAGSTFNPAADVSITFEVDFDGDNVIEPSAADAERVTYTYQRGSRRLLLQTPAESFPILAANVETFEVSFDSNLFDCDLNADGIATWEEMDAAPSPCRANGGISDGILNAELSSVDSITIELTVLTGAKRQEYRTTVFLRNH